MKYLLLLTFTMNTLWSVNLVPLYQTVDSKKTAKMIYILKNSSDKAIAVDFSVLQVIENSDAKERRIKTNKVTFYPAQLVIKKGDSKKVRVRYMATSLPKVEEVYRIIAKELNVNLQDEIEKVQEGKIKAKLQMRYSYEGLLFVKEPTAISQLEVVSFKELASKANKRIIKVVIQNHGTASSVPNMKKYNYIITINNQDYILKDVDAINMEIKRVLAKKSAVILFNNVSSLPQGSIQAIKLLLKK